MRDEGNQTLEAEARGSNFVYARYAELLALIISAANIDNCGSADSLVYCRIAGWVRLVPVRAGSDSSSTQRSTTCISNFLYQNYI